MTGFFRQPVGFDRSYRSKAVQSPAMFLLCYLSRKDSASQLFWLHHTISVQSYLSCSNWSLKHIDETEGRRMDGDSHSI